MTTSRLFYETSTYDSSSGLPLYVFDTSFLPKPILDGTASSTDDSITQLTNRLIAQMPMKDHCLVLLATGFSSYDSFSNANNFKMPLNLIKLFKIIPQDKKNHLVKIYIVHGNWIFRSLVDFLKNFWNNFKREIVHCENLTSLAQHIDITKIPISLTNYIIDNYIYGNERIVINKHIANIYGKPLIPSNQLALKQFSRVYNNLIAYLTTPELDSKLTAPEWQMLIRCGSEVDLDTRLAVDILSDCLKRDQALYLSDFSFLEHAMILFKFSFKLSDSNQPILPVSLMLDQNLDFSNVDQVTTTLNTALNYKQSIHQSIESKQTSNDSSMGNNNGDEYDNGYILTKLFKFFYLLLNKLDNEYEILEPNSKNLDKVKERQHLRLILSFTKILYNEYSDDPYDLGFDNMFKFIACLMKNYKTIKVLNSDLTFDDLNNSINLADMAEFEDFKTKTTKNNKYASDYISNQAESPIFEKRVKSLNIKLRSSNNPPTPPMPRKSQYARLQSIGLNSNGNTNQQSSPLRSISSSSEGSLYSEDDKENSVPLPTARTITERLKNELIKPSDQLTSKLIKYTEKDLVVQQQRMATLNSNGVVRSSTTIRGRNVSKLTMMYEEKFMAGL
ncbi:hypothetical protein CANARDRAFT_174476 [[Candida] arabinofermentans NRRL YB-2248]|uniref:CRAL-TRIO domain-containing protein n=1 Tax=[Candida] arabinofermentans NRRL YB-2248 TaxID=983967 RepID=A0A1E4T6X8_9ASCO|nr:hypothetical protein CANARDRAFT_174476 [[Candida] arabinofermentans NRRL YB-2248]